MMKTFILSGILICSVLISCHKGNNSSVPNAAMIRFNPEKCMCCWGWTFVLGKDTLKTEDARFATLFGYDITKPVQVYIELGERDQTCPNYYRINKIEIIK